MFITRNILESIYFLLKKNYSISDILKMDEFKDYMPYMVIYKLNTTYSDDKDVLIKIKEYYLNEYKVPNKVLVISDNHLGRLYSDEYIKYKKGIKKDKYKNEELLLSAYNYAINNNINTVIHAGDIIEGQSQGDKYKISNEEQLDYLKEFYSHLNGIKTYLLYGNHEYGTLYWDNVDESKFKNINNIEIIGLNHSYVSLDNKLIRVTHQCVLSNFMEMPEFESDFNLIGHKHFFSFNSNEKEITLPALTSINEYRQTGFIELQNEENEYVFKLLNTNGKKTNEYILHKN